MQLNFRRITGALKGFQFSNAGFYRPWRLSSEEKFRIFPFSVGGILNFIPAACYSNY